MSRATTGDVSSTEQGVFFVHLSRARKHLAEESYDTARRELELAQLARPNDEDVLNLLSVIEFKRGYYHEAAQAARALLKENPASAVLHSNLGLILFKAGVLGEAEQELRRAIELQPDHVRSHLYLGLLYRMRGKLGLALEHLRFAGAKRVVVEIEEALRRSMRDGSPRAGAPAPAAGEKESIPAAAAREPALPVAKPAPPSSAPAASAPPASASTGPITTAILKLAGPLAPPPPPQPPAVPGPSASAAAAPPAPSPSPATRETFGDDSLDQTMRVPTPLPPQPPAPMISAPGADSANTGRIRVADAAALPFPEAEADDEPGESTAGAGTPSTPPHRGPAATVPPRAAGAPPTALIETGLLAGSESPASPAPSALRMESDARPLFHVRPDGGLEVASRGVVFVRKGSVVWYSGKMRFSSEATFRGTRLEKILRADGRGYLFINDPGRHAFRRDLNGESLYLEGSRMLALDHGLAFRLEPIHDFRMNRRVDILKIFGRGSVILSVGGPLLAHEVSSEFPLNVSSRDLVAWTGDLVPSVLEDRFLEEVMMPDVGSAPKIRFEGEGTVLTEPPRPRRRASDLARPSESDRRS